MSIFENFNEKTKNSSFYKLPPFLLATLVLLFPSVFLAFAIYPLTNGSKIRRIFYSLAIIGVAVLINVSVRYLLDKYNF
jgi:hypothetical protein